MRHDLLPDLSAAPGSIGWRNCNSRRRPVRLRLVMMRRVAALLSGFLFLIFSVSGWRNVCDNMSHQSGAHATGGSTQAQGHHSAPTQSHDWPGKNAPTDHCQSASLCSGHSLVTLVAANAADHTGSRGVLLAQESAPSSEFPDLEPPPPRA